MSSENQVIGILESFKPNEKRIPIHPSHFNLINVSKNKIFFQESYATNFGVSDRELKTFEFNFAPRDYLLKNADVVFILKPLEEDLEKMKQGATVIGWCHVAQRLKFSKLAQQKKLTLIAMESMYRKNLENKIIHLFNENNFMAGSLGVEHALSSCTVKYPKHSKISVLTYGTVSKGAVTKFNELGFSDVTVFSRRPVNKIEVEDKIENVNYESLMLKNREFYTTTNETLKTRLLESNIIVNGIFQDILNPYEFLSRKNIETISDLLIIDLSCDDHMGFDFAHATSIDKPMVKIGKNFYYAVDNIPTLAWRSITVSISEQLHPILNAFLNENFKSEINAILKGATEVQEGVILNKTISEYQKNLINKISI